MNVIHLTLNIQLVKFSFSLMHLIANSIFLVLIDHLPSICLIEFKFSEIYSHERYSLDFKDSVRKIKQAVSNLTLP